MPHPEVIEPRAEPARDCLPSVPGHAVLARLARGGMSDVYLARDDEERDVVVKRVRADLASTEHATRLEELLVAEARLTEHLRHPNVVRTLGLGRDEEGQPYMVMELVAGIDLHSLLSGCSERRIALPVSLRLAIACAVLRALDYAHRARDERGAPFDVVHRDVSPANVLIGFDGSIKLCDFGIANATVMPTFDADAIEGKSGYMSPEHARGEPVDGRADLFACGILLWELLSGRRMRAGRNRGLDGARRGDVPPLVVRGLPEEPRLHGIVRRALCTDPDDRYPDAGAMMRDLERWCRENGMLAGESEVGRFVREHFAARRVALTTMRAQEPALAAGDDDEARPTRSGPRPVRRAPVTPPTDEPTSWARATPALFLAGVVTFAVLTVLSWLGAL